ncbi:DUF3135 domain-containing protein [Thalassolituus hydrocarboniclasticus]|uniref:DUF3135 domain-containing protein n=1 Tax=Thalassolituus hydrocarboniclasticus TaxID=2742796 RepID=A0ABY6A9K5_9GAMM|nr:DUF3135 domain-containing protein [Thalassolituus hydrocarboniclasticus]UXD87245.1 DUF3135 domain-containing protein [Thalassolituus hydrocarboniclasticus]
MQLPPFDELKQLADSNPEALETLRRQLIEQTINSAGDHVRRRLRGLQFQIDMERQRASNPLSACLRMSRMMHERLHTLTESLHTGGSHQKQPVPAEVATADVIPFPFRAQF